MQSLSTYIDPLRLAVYEALRAARGASWNFCHLPNCSGVIVVPGRDFGDTTKEAMRLCYGPLVHNLDKISQAMQWIGEFLMQA